MAISLVQSLGSVPLAFVDVETTGASCDLGDRVIEIGIVRVEGGKKVGEYQQLIDPQRRISAGVTALTGISQEMVVNQPRFSEQLPAMLPLLEGAVILGHNVRFDLSFLDREFRRAERDMVQALGDVPVLDTVRIARRRFGAGEMRCRSFPADWGLSRWWRIGRWRTPRLRRWFLSGLWRRLGDGRVVCAMSWCFRAGRWGCWRRMRGRTFCRWNWKRPLSFGGR